MAEKSKRTSLSVVSGSSDSCFPDSASSSSKETQREGVFGWWGGPTISRADADPPVQALRAIEAEHRFSNMLQSRGTLSYVAWNECLWEIQQDSAGEPAHYKTVSRGLCYPRVWSTALKSMDTCGLGSWGVFKILYWAFWFETHVRRNVSG